ncbi:MAG TPA: hypothetical protein VMQ76_09000 [Terracidiphilus sp.]|nr:hypothetical protein [Terracidiphilus sp.]
MPSKCLRKYFYIEEDLWIHLLIELHKDQLRHKDAPPSLSEWIRQQARHKVEQGNRKEARHG